MARNETKWTIGDVIAVSGVYLVLGAAIAAIVTYLLGPMAEAAWSAAMKGSTAGWLGIVFLAGLALAALGGILNKALR